MSVWFWMLRSLLPRMAVSILALCQPLSAPVCSSGRRHSLQLTGQRTGQRPSPEGTWPGGVAAFDSNQPHALQSPRGPGPPNAARLRSLAQRGGTAHRRHGPVPSARPQRFPPSGSGFASPVWVQVPDPGPASPHTRATELQGPCPLDSPTPGGQPTSLAWLSASPPAALRVSP